MDRLASAQLERDQFHLQLQLLWLKARQDKADREKIGAQMLLRNGIGQQRPNRQEPAPTARATREAPTQKEIAQGANTLPADVQDRPTRQAAGDSSAPPQAQIKQRRRSLSR